MAISIPSTKDDKSMGYTPPPMPKRDTYENLQAAQEAFWAGTLQPLVQRYKAAATYGYCGCYPDPSRQDGKCQHCGAPVKVS